MPAIDEILATEAPAFGRAVQAIVSGDAAALRAELTAVPDLVRARSQSAHRATLLHFVSANGIEPELQGPVPNADEIAALLLAAGAEVNAGCDAYGWSDTLGLVVSSDHPNEAGVAGRLVALLCSAGAAVDGPEGDGAPLAAALAFATLDCAEVLIARGARTDNPIFAAAAGRTDWLRAWLDGQAGIGTPPAAKLLPLSSDHATAAEQALVFASMCGQTAVARLLLDAGVNVDAQPPGSHWTGAPLHTAAVQGQVMVVEELLRRGADPTLKDTRYQSTPAGWLSHARGPRRALARAVAARLEQRRERLDPAGWRSAGDAHMLGPTVVRTWLPAHKPTAVAAKAPQGAPRRR